MLGQKTSPRYLSGLLDTIWKVIIENDTPIPLLSNLKQSYVHTVFLSSTTQEQI